jgi:two-component system, LytTR family, response regulator
MKLRCIVIEDEPLATDKLTGFIEKPPLLELVGSFDNALEAISFLNENLVDLIFLDIQMKGFSGIQFLETINQKPYVIITSAYDQYALKCYEFSVDDYLLKPYSFERFVKSVNKVAEFKAEQSKDKNNNAKDSIFVNTEYRLERIELKGILYIEGMKDYLKIVTTEKNILILQNFKGIQEILPPDEFVRIHKSFIVALNKIENIERNRIKIGKALIPISDTYKIEFYNLIDKQNRS